MSPGSCPWTLDPGWHYKRLTCCLPSFCPAPACLPACPPARLQAWQRICNASRVEFQKIYDRLGVQLEGKWDGVGWGVRWGVVQLAVGHRRSWRGSVAGSAALRLPATCHLPSASCRLLTCHCMQRPVAVSRLHILDAAPACCACLPRLQSVARASTTPCSSQVRRQLALAGTLPPSWGSSTRLPFTPGPCLPPHTACPPAWPALQLWTT